MRYSISLIMHNVLEILISVNKITTIEVVRHRIRRYGAPDIRFGRILCISLSRCLSLIPSLSMYIYI